MFISFLWILYDIHEWITRLILRSTTKPYFLSPFIDSDIQRYIICITLSADKVLFNSITISHSFNVIPNDNIFPANRINPNLPFSFATFSFLVISALISFTLSSTLELIIITSYLDNTLFFIMSSFRHLDISLIPFIAGKNHN